VLGPCRSEAALVLIELRVVTVELLLAGRPLGDQLLVAVDLHLQEPLLAQEPVDGARGGGELRRVGPDVDLVQRIALGHELAVAKRDFGEVAGDPAADVDDQFGIDPAGDLEVLRHLRRPRRRHDHLGDGRRWRRGLARAACGREESPDCQQKRPRCEGQGRGSSEHGVVTGHAASTESPRQASRSAGSV